MSIVRIATLVVDFALLEQFKSALKEQIEESIRVEPGVLTLYAVAEKDHPSRFTILEIYADQAAYEAHLTAPHFIKYKNATGGMVKALQLVESEPLIPGMKIK